MKGVSLVFSQESVILCGHAGSIRSSYNNSIGYMDHRFAFGKHGGAFFCNPLKIERTSLSSITSEYVALCEAARDVAELMVLLKDIGFAQNKSSVMFGDNNLSIGMIYGRSNHKASQHINPKTHFTRDQVWNGKLVIPLQDTEVLWLICSLNHWERVPWLVDKVGAKHTVHSLQLLL